MTDYVLVISEPKEYVDLSLPTASWWDRYELQPGEYPVVWKTVNWIETNRENAYYGQIRVDAILRESYRVNRLFTASSTERSFPNTNTNKTVTFSPYAYLFNEDSIDTLFSKFGKVVSV